jgi:beta-lactamase class D
MNIRLPRALFFIGTLLWISSCCYCLAEPVVNFVCIDGESGKTITMEGDCQTQESPCSTFKIALSLMGFDSGILKSEHEPKVAYDVACNAPLDIWRQSHNPVAWIKNCCIWYSQYLTSRLGMAMFQGYVRDFSYGNQDVSGDQGKRNGLQRAWLCSSLKISPLEQVAFIRKFLQRTLPVSEYAYEVTQKLIFLGDMPNGWKLYGKTGTGFYDDPEKSIGWFVGWVIKERAALIFACLVTSEDNQNPVNGGYAKNVALRKMNIQGA